jgi:hypothetical protein
VLVYGRVSSVTLRSCLPWSSPVSALAHNARNCLHRSWRHSEAVSPRSYPPTGHRGESPSLGIRCLSANALTSLRSSVPRSWTAVQVVRTGSDSRRAVLPLPSGHSEGGAACLRQACPGAHTSKRGVYYLPLTLAEGFRAVNPWLSTRNRRPVLCGGDSTVAIRGPVRERALGGALVHPQVRTPCNLGLTCVE